LKEKKATIANKNSAIKKAIPTAFRMSSSIRLLKK